MVFKSAAKSAARVIETAFPNVAKASNEEVVEDTIDLSKFDELKIDVSSVNTYIEQGDGYKLEYRVRERNVPTVDQKGDKLVIKQPSHFGINIVGLFEDKEEYYRLTVPKDAGIIDIDAELSSGTISVEELKLKGKIDISSGQIKLKSIEGEELKLLASSGNINVEDLTADELKFKLTSGNLNVEKCTTDKLEAEVTSGHIEFDEIKFNKADFDMTSGNIRANVIGKKSDYSYDLDATSGGMKIDGERYKDGYKSGDDKDHMISVDMTSGNLDISFSE